MKTKTKNRRLKPAIALSILLLASTATALPVTEDRLDGYGKTRTLLQASSGAEAAWNSFVQVHSGSASAQLTGSGGDTAKVDVGPLRIPLSRMSESRIQFWAYYEDNDESRPTVDLVLSNGRRLEGYRNTVPVGGTNAEIVDEVDLGYPSVGLWTQMTVQACPAAGSECGFYSSHAAEDPLIPDTFVIGTPKNLAQWAATFPGAYIVQARLRYGDDAAVEDYTVYVDSLRISGTIVDLEPSTGV